VRFAATTQLGRCALAQGPAPGRYGFTHHPLGGNAVAARWTAAKMRVERRTIARRGFAVDIRREQQFEVATLSHDSPAASVQAA
jgi:hypothetical protein